MMSKLFFILAPPNSKSLTEDQYMIVLTFAGKYLI